jgi:hypothetical protein
LQLPGARLSSASLKNEEDRFDSAGRFFASPRARAAACPGRRSERSFPQGVHDSQQGEKLEQDQQYAAALAKFRFAGSLLEELRKTHAEWQPAIVDYRARKIGESILRVQNKAGTQADLAATNQPPPPAASPFLPSNAGPAEPSVEIGPGKRGNEGRIPLPGVAQQQTQPAPQAPVAATAATCTAAGARAAAHGTASRRRRHA